MLYFSFTFIQLNDGNVHDKKGCNVLFQTKNTKLVKLMSRRGQLDNSCKVLCARRRREERGRGRGLKGKRREKRGISKMGLGGLRRAGGTLQLSLSFPDVL